MRIDDCFTKAAKDNRAALGIFVSAGDPDPETALEILLGLPGAGVDFVELGMPFSDPMADGPAIQAASQRALKGGMTLALTLEMAATFRKKHPNTPLILMGYYNPIYRYGTDAFIKMAVQAGVDGLIIVDLPPEEDDEFCLESRKNGLEMIRLIAPTTDDTRLPMVLTNSGGFVYYVSIVGITGTRSASQASTKDAIKRIKKATPLPVVVGFGIRNPEQVHEMAAIADGVVVGSAVVDAIADSLDTDGKASHNTTSTVLEMVATLSASCYLNNK